MKYQIKGNYFNGRYNPTTDKGPEGVEHYIKRECPADTSQVLWELPIAYNQVDEVIGSAVDGFKFWRKIPLSERINFLKIKRFPWFYKKIRFLIENDVEIAFERTLKSVRPDIVHSFVLHKSCLPIVNIMSKNPNIKWVYSSWGSDLYNRNGKPNYERNLKQVLPKIHYLFTDCRRDYSIAVEYGFKGEYLGALPGGGGFKYKDFFNEILPVSKRKIILVKGYQGKLGRAITVLEAILTLTEQFDGYEIIVFGADKEVEDFINKNKQFKKLKLKVFSKINGLNHDEVLKLMGKSLIYIGNSVSDGIPNTLLEAIVMGAFPIQSNPGNATAEVLSNGENGLLISDCNNIEVIKQQIIKALKTKDLLESAFQINQDKIRLKYEYNYIKSQTLLAYGKINF